MKHLIADVNLGGITGLNAYDKGVEGISGYGGALEKLISNTIATLTIIGGLMFIIYFLVGGLSWITAGGDQGKIENAKKKMTGAAIGIIIIALSYSISYIISQVVGIDILNPSKVLQGLF